MAVLGAGLQGVGVAIELALRGADVELYDREAEAVSRASLQNEGKVHLGLVYANDPSLKTGRLMLQGAACFAPALRRWTEGGLDGLTLSTPFTYLTHRDSLLSPEALQAYYRTVCELGREALSGPGADYLGASGALDATRLTPAELDERFDTRTVAAAFRTSELAVDPQEVAGLLRRRLEGDPRIRLRLGTEVLGVERAADGPVVQSDGPDGPVRERYDQVVNALWCGRLKVDRSAGIEPDAPWSFRVKHFLRLRAPHGAADAPSVTVALGPFGDVVNYGSGDLFLSWYPVGRRGMSGGIAPPDWPLPPPAAEQADIRAGVRAGLQALIPGLAGIGATELDSAEVQGGIIYAVGETDVDDRTSQLHQRARTGPVSYGRYHTVDTGKYSLAPLFALELAERILPS